MQPSDHTFQKCVIGWIRCCSLYFHILKTIVYTLTLWSCFGLSCNCKLVLSTSRWCRWAAGARPTPPEPSGKWGWQGGAGAALPELRPECAARSEGHDYSTRSKCRPPLRRNTQWRAWGRVESAGGTSPRTTITMRKTERDTIEVMNHLHLSPVICFCFTHTLCQMDQWTDLKDALEELFFKWRGQALFYTKLSI